MNYHVNFRFSKDDVPEDVKNVMINDFVTIREEVINIATPMLETWKKEFDSQIDKMKDDVCSRNIFMIENVYFCNIWFNIWFSEKINTVCDKVNKSHPESSIKIYCSPELNCDFVGIAKFDEDLGLHIIKCY